MQALIDFDGWRKWKEEVAVAGGVPGEGKSAGGKAKEETEQERLKREQKEARKASLLAKMGRG